MRRYSPMGWRPFNNYLDPDCSWMALRYKTGRGIVKNIEGKWFFIQFKKYSCKVIRVSPFDNILCLIPVRKDENNHYLY